MRVVQIEDDANKIDWLSRSSVPLASNDIIRNPAQLLDFLGQCSTSDANPGAAVVDVGVFGYMYKADMLQVGEDLAEAGWKVIYWSAVAGNPLEIPAGCWYEHRSDLDGAKAIAAALAELSEGRGLTSVQPGIKPRSLPLDAALELLSALLPIGLLWESRTSTCGKIGMIGSLAQIQHLSIGTPAEPILNRLYAWVMVVENGKPDLDPLGTNDCALMKQFSGLKEIAHSNGTDAFDADLALKEMAGASSASTWNASLAALRMSLLGS